MKSAPTASTYNYLLDATHTRVDVAWRAYQDMRDSGVTPDTLTFNLLLKAAWRAARADVAYNAMEDMQMLLAEQQMERAGGGEGSAVSCRPDVVTFTTLIAACGAARQPDRALAALDQMGRFGIEPNERTWASLAAALGGAGQLERALSVLPMMRARGAVPDTAVYNALLAACARAGDADAAENLLAEMRACDIASRQCARPDTSTYNTLIHACVATQDVAQAEALLAEMQEVEGLRPDAVTRKSMLAVAASAGDLSAAHAAMAGLREDGVRPDVECYTALIKCATEAMGGPGAGSGGDPSDVLAAYDAMLRAGLTPNVVTVHTLVSAAQRAGDASIMPRVFEAYRKARSRAGASAAGSRSHASASTTSLGSSSLSGGGTFRGGLGDQSALGGQGGGEGGGAVPPSGNAVGRRRRGVIPAGSDEQQLAWVFDRLTATWADLVCATAAEEGQDRARGEGDGAGGDGHRDRSDSRAPSDGGGVPGGADSVVSVAGFAGVTLEADAASDSGRSNGGDGSADGDDGAASPPLALAVDVSGLTASEARVAVLCMLRGMRRLWAGACPRGGLVISFEAEDVEGVGPKGGDARASAAAAAAHADAGAGAGEAQGTVRGELARLLHALNLPFSARRGNAGGERDGRRGRGRSSSGRASDTGAAGAHGAARHEMVVPEAALHRFVRSG